MVVAFYSIGKLGFLIPTGYMTASAYAKFPKRLGTGAETLLLVSANVLISVFFLSGLYAIAGALADVYNIKLGQAMAPCLFFLFLHLFTDTTNYLFFSVCFIPGFNYSISNAYGLSKFFYACIFIVFLANTGGQSCKYLTTKNSIS